jgi:hypothetical protein
VCWQPPSTSSASRQIPRRLPGRPPKLALAPKAQHPLADSVRDLIAGDALAQDIAELPLQVEIELDRVAAIEVGIGAAEMQAVFV